ncbi:hypothetical protein IWX64_001226 [Arthrobacter sp. CAN_A212]|uniref:HNH endonuclease signature motif containing protein n=1 Tax=unclassified Arthrobacter TaxID=235627 RepID=UPI0018CB9CE2|nr:HNH endonuclease signature motif containing protein [Arthrobacter sp. CAN_C5]MBP2217489.1 hypothetical protein [Arthrobacter sp. CAN_C5]
MSITHLDVEPRPADVVGSLRDTLLAFAGKFADQASLMSTLELANTVAAVEKLSHVVEYLQVLGARAVDWQNIAATGESAQTTTWNIPAAGGGQTVSEFRDTPDYLRARLLIGRSEARRRLRLAASVVPPRFLNGTTGTPRLEHLSAAMGDGQIGDQAAVIISESIERVRPAATTPQAQDLLAAMERALTAQAVESDTDVLRVVARHWEAALDQDGREPSDELLRSRQGVFLKGMRSGLHRLEIVATEGQFEVLTTAMNTAANPRIAINQTQEADHDAGSAPDGLTPEVRTPDGRTRAQMLLDGLVGACRLALTTSELPATGGHRPQVMVTIGFEELLGRVNGTGHAVFAGPVSPGTVRRIACDADIVPVVLGGSGEILDVGRARRFFGPGLRRALIARDKGCSFPDCMIPAVWCEAHHIDPWSASGRTRISNGVLLCGHHHDLMDQGNWTIDMRRGIPWFIPPPYVDPERKPRRNRYRHVSVSTAHLSATSLPEQSSSEP